MSTFYVNPLIGDDSNTVVDAQDPLSPWKSYYNISGGSPLISDGDTVLFNRGTTILRSQVLLDHPGADRDGAWSPSNLNNVVFGAYGTGAKPIIDVDTDQGGLYTHCGYNGALTNATFENLEFYNSVARDSAIAGQSHLMTAHAACNNLTFSYCDFDATNESGLGSGSLKNETLSIDCNGIIIDHCSAIGASPYNRHGFYVDGIGTRMTNNYVRGFGISGLKINGSSSNDGIISHNTIIDAGVAIDVAYSDSNDIFSNVIIQTGVYTTGNPKAIQLETNSSAGQEPHNNKVFNNTIIVNIGSGLCRTFSSYKNDGDWVVDKDNEFSNNIIYYYNGTGSYFIHMKGETGRTPFQNPNPADNNIYHSEDGGSSWYADSVLGSVSSLAAWKALGVGAGIVDFEANSLDSDPLFIGHSLNNENPLSYELSLGSPAIDAGKAITPNNLLWSEVTDFNGDSFLTDDIGAFAYIPASGTDPSITKDTTPRANLSIVASNYDSLQWFQDGVLISGATAATFLTPELAVGADSVYFCRVYGNGTSIDSASIRVTNGVVCLGLSYNMIV